MNPPWLQLPKMSKPVLLIIAGCNGAGKSSFSKLLAENDFEPFDYDYFFLKFYHSLPDSELRDKMAHHLAFEELEKRFPTQFPINKTFATKQILIQPHYIGLIFLKIMDSK